MIEFKKFPKIPRLNYREYFITEKIDGTNACVVVDADGNVAAQSRNTLITVNNDNFGFASWVENNKDELQKLGTGHHYGEWWGKGIQRGYNKDERIFSLFFPQRYYYVPNICRVVPIFEYSIEKSLEYLLEYGSVAAKGFMKPEGLIIIDKNYPNCKYKIILHEGVS